MTKVYTHTFQKIICYPKDKRTPFETNEDFFIKSVVKTVMLSTLVKLARSSEIG